MIINSEIFENIFNSGSNSKGLSSKSRKKFKETYKEKSSIKKLFYDYQKT